MVREFPKVERITEQDIENLFVLEDQIQGRLKMKQQLADRFLDRLAAEPEANKKVIFML